MLVSLKIENIAIIEKCEIKFRDGLNILTGETGSGKSILIDSLNFVLGARADKGLIKNGKDYAKVEGVFYVDENNLNIKNFFLNAGMECEDTIIITRKMNSLGKNEVYINGQSVTLGMLKKLTLFLVDVYGQFEHQVLLDEKTHINFVDILCGDKLTSYKDELQIKLNKISDCFKEISALGGNKEERARNIDMLNFQINEINDANLYENEEDDLVEKRDMLNNAEKIYSSLSNAYNFLYGSEYSSESTVKSSANMLSQISNIKNNYSSLEERLNSLKFELNDISNEISNELSLVTFSENEINEVEDRLNFISSLKRKYGNSIKEILQFKDEAENKLDTLINAGEKIINLNNEINKLKLETYNICLEISKIRKNVAESFEVSVVSELKELGMKNASFKVEFLNSYTCNNILDYATSNGADEVEFMFSANLGEPVKPINKIISGGEMSRFMLAFKCVLNNSDTFKTLVFDEIDAGIGGEIGKVLAHKMYNISRKNQVICITHLPQIACFADAHFKITKTEDDVKTITNVNLLSEENLVYEISRMLGGDKSDISMQHAMELIKNAELIKNNNN